MKYCHNCGKQLGDGVNFCPECGTRVNGAVMPAEEKPKSRALAIVLIILAVLAVIGIVVAVLLFVLNFKAGTDVAPVQPAIEVEESILPEKAEEQIPEEAPAVSPGQQRAAEFAALDPAGQFTYVIKNAPEYVFTPFADAYAAPAAEEKIIDTDLSVSIKAPKGAELLNSLKADIKLYLDSRGASVVDVNVKMMGFFGISGVMTYDNETLGLEIFDKYYTVTLEELAKMISEDMPEEALASAQAAFDREKTAADFVEAFNILLSYVNAGNVSRSEGSVTLEYAGGTVDAVELRFAPTADEMEKAITQLCDFLLNSEIIKAVNAQSNGDDVTSEIASLKRNAGSVAKELYEQDFAMTVVSDGEKLYEISIGPAGEEIVFQINADENSGKFVLLSRENEKGKLQVSEEIVCEYSVENGRVTGRLELGGEAIVEFSFSLTESSALGIPYGSFTLTVPGENIKLALNTYAKSGSGSTHVFTVSDTEQGETVRITADSSDKPSGAKIPDIPATEVTSENINEIADEIAGILDMFN